MNGSALRMLTFAALLLVSCAAPAAAADSPRHLGAATCASALCHSAPRPFADAGIRQNEYLVWHRKDRHAGAWRTLQSERSQRIAAALGSEAATERDDCLACHAAPITEQPMGPRYRVEDGVDCETCHGPAEHWIKPHTRGYDSVAARRDDGLFPTWDTGERAALCLSCHQDRADREIDHEIMAAGHPLLRFELDTYTTTMPPHFRREHAAAIGKPAYSPIADWRLGQLHAVRTMLTKLERHLPARQWVPELSLFDCHACHHDMRRTRWHAKRSPSLPTGHPRLAEQPLVMLQLWLNTVDDPLAGDWLEARRALDQAVIGNQAAREAAIDRLNTLIDAQLAATPPEVDPRALALGMLNRADSALAGDFALAEQMAMMAAVLVNELRERNALGDELRTVAALDRLYEAVADSRRFDPAPWRHALWALIGSLES